MFERRPDPKGSDPVNPSCPNLRARPYALTLHTRPTAGPQAGGAAAARPAVALLKEQLRAVTDFGARIPMPADLSTQLARLC